MIRPQDSIMDNHVSYTRNERLRDQEIIKPPADTPLTGVEDVRPPCVLHALRIQLPEDIHKSVIEIFLHPCAFLGQKAGGFVVRFWVFQVYGLVGGIEVSGENQSLPFRVPEIT